MINQSCAKTAVVAVTIQQLFVLLDLVLLILMCSHATESPKAKGTLLETKPSGAA